MSACATEEVVSATAAAVAASGKPGFIDISEAELDALIKRMEEAIAFNLALNADDYRLLINAAVMPKYGVFTRKQDTMMGFLLSMQRVKAVESMTLSWRSRHS